MAGLSGLKVHSTTLGRIVRKVLGGGPFSTCRISFRGLTDGAALHVLFDVQGNVDLINSFPFHPGSKLRF